MEFFQGQLPPALSNLPDQAKRELASLLLATPDADSKQIQLTPDIEAKLQEVLDRIDSGSEQMIPANDVLKYLRAKYV